MAGAILRLRTILNAVRKDRFQPVEIGSNHVDVLICDYARKVLAHALSHDARLSMVDLKAFLEQNRCDVGRKPFDASLEISVARKGEIIRVARILRPCRSREPRQAAVCSIRTKVRERR